MFKPSKYWRKEERLTCIGIICAATLNLLDTATYTLSPANQERLLNLLGHLALAPADELEKHRDEIEGITAPTDEVVTKYEQMVKDMARNN